MPAAGPARAGPGQHRAVAEGLGARAARPPGAPRAGSSTRPAAARCRARRPAGRAAALDSRRRSAVAGAGAARRAAGRPAAAAGRSVNSCSVSIVHQRLEPRQATARRAATTASTPVAAISRTAARGSSAASSFSSSLADPLGGEAADQPLQRCAGRQRRGVGLAPAVPGEEAEEAQDAQGVLADAGLGRRRRRRSRPARASARPSPVGSNSRAVAVGVEGVQAEVAPRGVLGPVVGEGDHGAAAVGLDVAAQGGDLERLAVGDRRHRAVLDAGRDGLQPGAPSAPRSPRPGVSVVAMSMSPTGRPSRALRTQPPTKRAQSAPPAASRAAITARVAGCSSTAAAASASGWRRARHATAAP